MRTEYGVFTIREVHPGGGVIEPDQAAVLVQTIVAIMRSPFTIPAGLAIEIEVPLALFDALLRKLIVAVPKLLGGGGTGVGVGVGTGVGVGAGGDPPARHCDGIVPSRL